MPKVVDHDERRREIAEAVWRVIARDGMAAASARTVAAEGGWSLGAVRHYFSSQDELMLFAVTEMIDGVVGRLQAIRAAHRPGPARCRRVLEQLLPLDERRTGEVRVWLAALIRSHVDPAFDEVRRAGWDGTRRICRGVVLELAGREGAAPSTPLGARLEAQASDLHTWVDGLTLQSATMPDALPADEVRRQVRTHVRRLGAALAPSHRGEQPTQG
ncbi:TetR/AcrR family transcriptional regulator [Nocardioides sambongensis]|uniref:TetR/AcrR family transcriptional regulator n=1 Tax=Nocardioides sambongensis TaxID=2589074 RepID=UPI00112E6106|nr:TetR/AcrR family transcriptional regulator [Nocardioides sambongensis]